MNIFDIIFLICFILLLVFLMIFGILSFLFNYIKFLKLKKKINDQELQASKNLKETINSQFWVYILIFNSKLMDEANKLVYNSKNLNTFNKKYKHFEKLQFSSLLALILIFVFYVATKILSAWFFKN